MRNLKMLSSVVGAALLAIILPAAAPSARAAELWVGAATADITPDRPVPLTGGTTVRVSKGVLSRCTANVLALESRGGQRIVDQAILVSCDLCVIRPGIQEGFRRHLAGRLPGVDLNKLFLAATHTHDAPVILQDRYDEKDFGDAMQPKEYVPWMYEQMAQAVVKAWESRAVGAWGMRSPATIAAWFTATARPGCTALPTIRGSARSRAMRTTPSTRRPGGRWAGQANSGCSSSAA